MSCARLGCRLLLGHCVSLSPLSVGVYVLFGICLSVCLSACLFVCVLATSHKSYWSDLHENFIRIASTDPESRSRPDLPSQRYTLPECSCWICVKSRTSIPIRWRRKIPLHFNSFCFFSFPFFFRFPFPVLSSLLQSRRRPCRTPRPRRWGS